MRQRDPKDLVRPDRLLDLWMGPENEPAPRPPRMAPAVRLAIALVVVAAVILMAKYAFDVLAMLAALAAVGFVLHILGIRLAESDLLSPGWFLIFVLSVAFLAYALFVPAASVAGVNRYVPKWVTRAVEWSEERGWAGRVFTGPGDSSGPVAVPVESVPPRSTAPPVSSAGLSAPPLTLTASSSTSQQGQIVTLMARLPADDETTQQVVFYDGLTRLGAANVRPEGRVRIAYLGVRGLGAGEHEFHAEVGGLLNGGSQRSATLRHTVLGRAR